MSTKKHLVAFTALLFPAILLADSVAVTFDAALTNATGWTYSDSVKISADSDKHVFFDTLKSFIQSQEYQFFITSLKITLSCSNTNVTRRLQVKPSTGTSLQTANVTSKNKKEVQSFLFDMADCVRSFNISLEGSGQTGNWHIYSAVISGVPLIEAPADLQADDIKKTRCDLSWMNPENAVSNKIEVSRVIMQEECGTMLDEYDFITFTNTATSARDCYNKNSLQMDVYSSFSGTNIYAAGNSTGVVQISSRENRGYLKYNLSTIRAALDEADSISLLVSAQRHSSDTSGTFGLKITVVDADDNSMSCITNNLAYEFPEKPVVVPLQEASSGTAVIFEPSDTTKGNRRILIEYLAFVRDYSPASVSTNLVKTAFAAGTTTYSVKGLVPSTEYIARATAFDADGNESAPSEPLTFKTDGVTLPLVIKLR